MKMKIAVLILFLTLTAGCTSWHSAATDVNVSGEDIVYLKDDRTDLCYAVLFVANKVGTSIKQMSMTSVPCDSLEGVSTK